MVLPPQLKRWSEHLSKYKKSHPNKSLKECMEGAKKTYKKKGKAKKGGSFMDKYKIPGGINPNTTKPERPLRGGLSKERMEQLFGRPSKPPKK